MRQGRRAVVFFNVFGEASIVGGQMVLLWHFLPKSFLHMISNSTVWNYVYQHSESVLQFSKA